jgi:hypothetical protein
MQNIGGGELLILGALLGVIPGAIASRKGHPFVLWWIFGALIFILALPMSLIIGPNRDGQKQCPACRSWIDREATRCAHCTADLTAAAP